MSAECPAHTDDRHQYKTKCECGEKGTIHLSILGESERLYIVADDAVVVTVDTLAAAIHPEGKMPTVDCCMKSTYQHVHPDDWEERHVKQHREDAAAIIEEVRKP